MGAVVSLTKVSGTNVTAPVDLLVCCPKNACRNSSVAADTKQCVALLGYARVSTSDQSIDGQLDALRAAGCEYVWTDVASGARARRPGLDELAVAAGMGDIVVVTRLDRLGRSLPHLLGLVEDLTARDVGLRSLAEQIDTSSAAGRLVLHVFGRSLSLSAA